METPTIYLASQKGGVNRSALSVSIGIEYVKNNWTPHIADLDGGQHSSYAFGQRRIEAGIEPQIDVVKYPTWRSAIKAKSICDVLIIDGALRASKDTLPLANSSDLVVIPTGPTIDDLEPALDLANIILADTELSMSNIMFVVTKVPERIESQAVISIRTIKKYRWYCCNKYLRYMTTYANALDGGNGLTETSNHNLNLQAGAIIGDIIQRLGVVRNGR